MWNIFTEILEYYRSKCIKCWAVKFCRSWSAASQSWLDFSPLVYCYLNTGQAMSEPRSVLISSACWTHTILSSELAIKVHQSPSRKWRYKSILLAFMLWGSLFSRRCSGALRAALWPQGSQSSAGVSVEMLQSMSINCFPPDAHKAARAHWLELESGERGRGSRWTVLTKVFNYIASTFKGRSRFICITTNHMCQINVHKYRMKE